MTIDPLHTDQPAIVYIDFKSPYAYLAIEPTRALERELGVQFDWRPFVLDIPSYLGSARLDQTGAVIEHNRSEEQWAGVKHAYYDCRRYATLGKLTIRGTTKIWDTNLAATAMLWAARSGYAAVQRFIDCVYPLFWNRQLDIEDPVTVQDRLREAGVDTDGFADWARREGAVENEQFQTRAFDSGVYGVPTYVVGQELYFGREHLPRVHWHLTGETGPAPDIGYRLPSVLPEQSDLPARISIGIDDSMDSLLGLPGMVRLLRGYRGAVDWVLIPPKSPSGKPDPTPADHSRAARHQRWRATNRAANRERYGPAGLDPADYPAAISDLLRGFAISPSREGPEQLLRPPMPGMVVLWGDELFIGRQHLPLLAARLGAAILPDA